jgi:methionyl aminopeptidase
MVILKSPEEIELMAVSGRVAATIMDELLKMVRPGIRTGDIDDAARELIEKEGGVPSFLNYYGYPASICVSVNEEIVHGIPGDRILADGDIVSIDLGVKINGYHSDMTVTTGCGNISKEASSLINVARDSLMKGISVSRVGNRLGDVSASIQEFVENAGYSVVRDYCGHGIGQELHEKPDVPNFGTRNTGMLLEEGLVFALEPMVVMDSVKVKINKGTGGWTAVTVDGSLASHYEHTVAICPEGPRILTIKDG